MGTHTITTLREELMHHMIDFKEGCSHRPYRSYRKYFRYEFQME